MLHTEKNQDRKYQTATGEPPKTPQNNRTLTHHDFNQKQGKQSNLELG
jgi:hypothetical protein